MSFAIQESPPAGPLGVLEDLRSSHAIARAKFTAALAAFRSKGGYGSSESDERRSLSSFSGTADGKRLEAAWLATEQRLTAAMRYAGSICIGGSLYQMSDVQLQARESVWRAAAEHGLDCDSWPATVRDEVMRLLKESPRGPTYGEYTDARRSSMRLAVNAATGRVIAEHGADPSKWPDESIDDIARIQARLDAFDALVLRARHADAEWGSRSTEVQR